MSSPVFSQPERRSFLVPAVLALVAVAAAVLLAMHFFPATTVDIAHVHTDVVPTETVFKGSTVIGMSETTQTLFVASDIRIDNQLRMPIFLDDFDIALTDPAGAELTAKAVTKAEIPDLETNFPALKPLLARPLQRDTAIDPGKSAEGTILYSLRMPQSVWDGRKTAVIKVSIYHQPAVYVTIPK